MSSDINSTYRARHFHLPDFCTAGSTLAVVLIVELVAILLTVARQFLQLNFWVDLSGNSLFILWQGLISSAVLCRSKSWLTQRSVTQAYALTLTLMVLVALIVAESIYQVGQLMSMSLLDQLFPTQHSIFLLRTGAIAFIVSSLALRYFHISAEWRSSIELEAQARIRALQARIRPHFF